MEWIDSVIEFEFNRRALLGAVMIGFVNGYFGGYVVLKRASLFAGALSHTLFPGIAIGALIAGLNPASAFLGAMITALLVGVTSQAVSTVSRVDPNAALAILYPFAFAFGLLILRYLSMPVVIEHYLFGNILGLSDFDLWFLFGIGLAVMSFLLLFQRPLILLVFSREVAMTQGIPVVALEFAIALFLVLVMITSLKAVGTIMTLGLLVAPATTLYLFFDSPKKILYGGGLLGAGVSVFSVFVSNWFNIQTGPLIVLVLGGVFVLAFLFSPRYGLLHRWLMKLRTLHSDNGADEERTVPENKS
jgi:ABC-type Mn2+/Zn2+ transport system permease subunit